MLHLPARRALVCATALASAVLVCPRGLRAGTGDDRPAATAAPAVVPPRPPPGVRPSYPLGPGGPRAKVTLDLTVSETGAVEQARVLAVEPPDADPRLAEAALAFVRSLAFEPALVDGHPAAVALEFVVHLVPPAADAPEEAPSPGVFHTEVEGSRPPPAAAASDVTVDPARVRAVPRRSSAELLTLAPGLLLTRHGGEGHASNVFLRGFDAGEGQDLEVLVAGVPINEPSNPHGHGYADPGFVIPEVVRSLRVIEGPFDPAQGDFAVAGTAAYELGLAQRGVTAGAEVGSFGATRLLLLWGPRGERPGTFAAADLRRGDGFGPSRSFLNGGAMGGLELVRGGLHLQLLAASHAADFDSAGVVREDDVGTARLACDAPSRFCTYDPDQGGAVTRHLVVARLSGAAGGARLSQAVWLSVRSLRLRENFTGDLLDARGDATEARYEALTVGLSGTLAAGPEQRRVEIGYRVRRDAGDAWLSRRRASGGQPHDALLDEGLTLTSVGLFASGAVRPVRWLRLRAGARAEAFFLSVVDRDQPASDRAGVRLPYQAQDASGLALSPRGGVDVSVTPELTWITSAGLGARSTDAAALSQDELAPFARVRAAETGLVWSPGALSLRGVAYLTHVDRDLVFDEKVARNVLVGPSNRYGALAAADLHLPHTDVLASVTWAEAHLQPEGAAPLDLGAGPRLPYVPRLVTRVDAVSRAPLPLELTGTLALGLTWIAPRPLPLDRYGEPYVLVDVAGGLRRGALELSLQVQNVLDVEWAAAEFFYRSSFDASRPTSLLPVRHFSAGHPRLFLVTAAVHFDPEDLE